MSLRRTAMTRRTELRRTPMTRAKREAAARATRTVTRPRDTGPSRAVRTVVAERAAWCCEVCGVPLHDGRRWDVHSIHHRQPRGQGGSSRPEVNAVYNLLLVCGDATSPGCHANIESQRTDSYALGYLVKHGQDPANAWVVVYPGRSVLLTADGAYTEAA